MISPVSSPSPRVAAPLPPSSAPRAPLPGKVVRSRSTPALLRLGWMATSLGAVLFGLAMGSGVGVHRAGFQSVGRDSAPSIIATQTIKSTLSDMDANLINQLLVPPQNASRKEVQDSVRHYEARRVEFSKALLIAAGNITSGDLELRPITTLQTDTGRYERLGAQALLSHKLGDDDAARASYQKAGAVLRDSLLPAATALDKANSDALQLSYEAQGSRARWAMFWLWLSALTLLGPLVALQLFLARRTRRTLNPGLGAATLLALALLLYTTRTFALSSETLRSAKKDAFESVSALSQGHAVAFDLNADESRWLLVPTQKAFYKDAFLSKVTRLATLSPDGAPEARAGQIVQASSGGEVPSNFDGLLATELRNITFEGERDSANRTLQTFAHYLALDPQIRAFDKAGQHEQAVELCISYKPGGSNEAFDAFSKALDDTLAINQTAFNRLTDSGFAGLAGREWLALGTVVALIALISLGLRPRLREYDV